MPITSVMLVTRREPSRRRFTWMIRSTESAIWRLIASFGTLMSDIITMFSIRASASRGELEWSVHIEPSWPVFMAASMSKHSAAANFAQDDAIRAHTQRVDDEIADGDRALALQVGRAGFQRQPVRLLQAKLGRVLDRDARARRGRSSSTRR